MKRSPKPITYLPPAPGKLYLTLYQDGWTKGYQLSLDDANGGFRLAGPKFNGSSTTLMRHELRPRDADAIRTYLDTYFPILPSTPPTIAAPAAT